MSSFSHVVALLFPAPTAHPCEEVEGSVRRGAQKPSTSSQDIRGENFLMWIFQFVSNITQMYVC